MNPVILARAIVKLQSITLGTSNNLSPYQIETMIAAIDNEINTGLNNVKQALLAKVAKLNNELLIPIDTNKKRKHDNPSTSTTEHNSKKLKDNHQDIDITQSC